MRKVSKATTFSAIASGVFCVLSAVAIIVLCTIDARLGFTGEYVESILGAAVVFFASATTLVITDAKKRKVLDDF